MRPHCIAAAFWLAATWSAAAGQGAENRLEQWKQEAEELSGGKIEVLRIGGGIPLALPEVVTRALADPAFRQNLAAAHALTVNWDGLDGRAHFVLLNLRLSDQWKDAEEGLLAHEIGHIWLNARGYRSPSYEPGPRACLSILAGDIPQHVLIRGEMSRRGIAGSRYWLGNLELAMRLIEQGKTPGTLEPCQKLVVLSQWMDARLGASAETWAERECFEALYRKTYPRLRSHADGLDELLRGVDLEDTAEFARTVPRVRTLLEGVFGAPD